MRVISGTHRRRTLIGPDGDRVTRPIPDRVKASVFDRLQAHGQLAVDTVIDVFAGTGSLGIEALSRGVGHAVFIERDRSARNLLQKNLETLQLTDRATVLTVDALASGWIHLINHREIGLVFLDPPYKTASDPESAARVASLIASLGAEVEPESALMLRTDKHTQPEPVDGWVGPTSYNYGSTTVHMYDRQP